MPRSDIAKELTTLFQLPAAAKAFAEVPVDSPEREHILREIISRLDSESRLQTALVRIAGLLDKIQDAVEDAGQRLSEQEQRCSDILSGEDGKACRPLLELEAKHDKRLTRIEDRLMLYVGIIVFVVSPLTVLLWNMFLSKFVSS